jgi:hypothetical protein
VTAITPRPIAFVSSMSAEGDYNVRRKRAFI